MRIGFGVLGAVLVLLLSSGTAQSLRAVPRTTTNRVDDFGASSGATSGEGWTLPGQAPAGPPLVYNATVFAITTPVGPGTTSSGARYHLVAANLVTGAIHYQVRVPSSLFLPYNASNNPPQLRGDGSASAGAGASFAICDEEGLIVIPGVRGPIAFKLTTGELVWVASGSTNLTNTQNEPAPVLYCSHKQVYWVDRTSIRAYYAETGAQAFATGVASSPYLTASSSSVHTLPFIATPIFRESTFEVTIMTADCAVNVYSLYDGVWVSGFQPSDDGHGGGGGGGGGGACTRTAGLQFGHPSGESPWLLALLGSSGHTNSSSFAILDGHTIVHSTIPGHGGGILLGSYDSIVVQYYSVITATRNATAGDHYFLHRTQFEVSSGRRVGTFNLGPLYNVSRPNQMAFNAQVKKTLAGPLAPYVVVVLNNGTVCSYTTANSVSGSRPGCTDSFEPLLSGNQEWTGLQVVSIPSPPGGGYLRNYGVATTKKALYVFRAPSLDYGSTDKEPEETPHSQKVILSSLSSSLPAVQSVEADMVTASSSTTSSTTSSPFSSAQASTTMWTFNTPIGMPAPGPVVLNDVSYTVLTTCPQNLYLVIPCKLEQWIQAISIESGTMLWSLKLNNTHTYPKNLMGYGDDLLFVPTGNNSGDVTKSTSTSIVAVSAQTGEVVWHIPIPGLGPATSCDLHYQNSTLFAVGTNSFYRLDPADGTVLFSAPIPFRGNLASPPPRARFTSALLLLPVRTLDGTVFAIDLHDGSLAWTFYEEGPHFQNSSLLGPGEDEGFAMLDVSATESYIYQLSKNRLSTRGQDGGFNISLTILSTSTGLRVPKSLFAGGKVVVSSSATSPNGGETMFGPLCGAINGFQQQEASSHFSVVVTAGTATRGFDTWVVSSRSGKVQQPLNRARIPSPHQVSVQPKTSVLVVVNATSVSGVVTPHGTTIWIQQLRNSSVLEFPPVANQSNPFPLARQQVLTLRGRVLLVPTQFQLVALRLSSPSRLSETVLVKHRSETIKNVSANPLIWSYVSPYATYGSSHGPRCAPMPHFLSNGTLYQTTNGQHRDGAPLRRNGRWDGFKRFTGLLQGVDVDTGKILLGRTLSTNLLSASPSAEGDGMLFFFNETGPMAFRKSDGALVWSANCSSYSAKWCGLPSWGWIGVTPAVLNIPMHLDTESGILYVIGAPQSTGRFSGNFNSGSFNATTGELLSLTQYFPLGFYTHDPLPTVFTKTRVVVLQTSNRGGDYQCTISGATLNGTSLWSSTFPSASWEYNCVSGTLMSSDRGTAGTATDRIYAVLVAPTGMDDGIKIVAFSENGALGTGRPVALMRNSYTVWEPKILGQLPDNGGVVVVVNNGYGGASRIFNAGVHPSDGALTGTVTELLRERVAGTVLDPTGNAVIVAFRNGTICSVSALATPGSSYCFEVPESKKRQFARNSLEFGQTINTGQLRKMFLSSTATTIQKILVVFGLDETMGFSLPKR